jgi:hypothetical protein
MKTSKSSPLVNCFPRIGRITKHLLSVIFLIQMVACGRSQPTQIGPVMLTPSITHTITTSLISTEPPATPAEPPAVLTDLPMVKQDNCLEMTPASRSEIQSVKGLVLFDQKKGNAYFWDGAGDALTYLPLQPGGRMVDPSVSPDHNFILYSDGIGGKSWNLVITDNKAKIVYTKTFDPAKNLYGWFDGKRLWNFMREEETLGKFLLINSFRGTQQVLKVDFPELKGQLPNRWQMPNTIYDPSLTRVVYAGCDEKCPAIPGNTETGWPVFLYNLETDSIIAKILTQDHFGTTPIWLPDGNAFIIAADLHSEDDTSQEFFSMSREGILKQLTHLRDGFESSEVSKAYSMSSDGSYLAFWLKVQPPTSAEGSLAILDLQTGNIKDYCLGGFPSNNIPWLDALWAPVWSPDGTQLAIASRNMEMPASSRIAIVDLTHGTAVQVTEMNDVIPIGWLLIP